MNILLLITLERVQIKKKVVLSTLTITDEHSFTIKETTADTSEDAAADTTEAADTEEADTEEAK